VNVIKRSTLKQFWLKHPHAKSPLVAWYKILRRGKYTSFNELREDFSSADLVKQLTIFDIGGNKYRLIAFIRYTAQTVFIKHILTHEEYNEWNKQTN
jgi:mRNA interferase HigB